jgi:hypothetical protein
MSTCDTECTITASERTFAHLWALSGARRLVGYEAMLLTVLARTDLPLYEQLTAVDLDDPDSVLDAVEAIQAWRRAVAAGTRSFAFGPRPPKTGRHPRCRPVSAGDTGMSAGTSGGRSVPDRFTDALRAGNAASMA